VLLLCLCSAAVPQRYPCDCRKLSAASLIHPRARTTRMHVFWGRMVQRWWRKTRTRDPLLHSSSGPHFAPTGGYFALRFRIRGQNSLSDRCCRISRRCGDDGGVRCLFVTKDRLRNFLSILSDEADVFLCVVLFVARALCRIDVG
jgi:hypothetical protein